MVDYKTWPGSYGILWNGDHSMTSTRTISHYITYIAKLGVSWCNRRRWQHLIPVDLVKGGERGKWMSTMIPTDYLYSMYSRTTKFEYNISLQIKKTVEWKVLPEKEHIVHARTAFQNSNSQLCYHHLFQQLNFTVINPDDQPFTSFVIKHWADLITLCSIHSDGQSHHQCFSRK